MDGTSSMPLVALVCAEGATRRMLRFLWRDAGCEVIATTDATTLAALTSGRSLSLVAAVGATPDEALDAVTWWRAHEARVPLLLLMHGADRQLRRRAFALGAQDVISLPAAPRDLQVRLRAALPGWSGGRTPLHGSQRVGAESTPGASSELVRAGGLLLQTRTRQVSDGNGWMERLTPRETILLHTLMTLPGRAIGRQELLDRVWSESYEGAGAVLDVYVRRLRAKLARSAPAHRYVHTVHGYGYVFDARVSPRVERAGPRQRTLAVSSPTA